MITGDAMYILTFIAEKDKTRNEIKSFVEQKSDNWKENAVQIFDSLISRLVEAPHANLKLTKLKQIDRVLANACELCMRQ